MTEHNLGLRDRKRIETRARLESAAIELVLRDGLHHATVEAICAAADVSPRTFFNYFETKEDAILGTSRLVLTDDVLSPHSETADSGDVLEAVIGLLVELATPSLKNSQLHARRIEILARYPELAARQVSRLTYISDDLVQAVRKLMNEDPRFNNLAEAASLMADPILAMCAATVRIAAKEWIAADRDDPLIQVKTRALRLAREVVDTLA